jgi:hypothetical protein
MTAPTRSCPCTCGHIMTITRDLLESPPGTPVHCPSCNQVWRLWQLIVRSNREGAK